MAQGEAFGVPGFGGPAGADAGALAAGIETESADGHEDMARAGEDCDPFSLAGSPVFPETGAGHGCFQQAGIAQDIGDAAGTIQSAGGIAVASSVLIGGGLDVIGGLHGPVHGGRGVAGSDDSAVGKDGAGTVVVVLSSSWGIGATSKKADCGRKEDLAKVFHFKKGGRQGMAGRRWRV